MKTSRFGVQPLSLSLLPFLPLSLPSLPPSPCLPSSLNSPQFSEGFLKVQPTLREVLYLLSEHVKGVVQLSSQLPLCLFCHEVITIVHVLRSTQIRHDLSNLHVHEHFNYRIVRKFGGELYLEVWWYAFKPPN